MGGAASRGASGQKVPPDGKDFQLHGPSLHSPPGRKSQDPRARANQVAASASTTTNDLIKRGQPPPARTDKFGVAEARASARPSAQPKPWGPKPSTPQELASEECTPRAQAARRKLEEQEDMSIEQQTAQQYKAFEAEQRRKEGGGEAARRKLEEQEDMSIEQQTAQQYKAFEAEQRRKEGGGEAARRKLEEQEDMSIEQQTAQQYKAFEAEQRRKEGGGEAARRKLEEQEDMSIEQQTAQQYKAFEAEQRRKEGGDEAARRKLEEQEDMSIEQQTAQQYTAFAKQQQEADAVAEADNLLNAFAPPRKSEQPRMPSSQRKQKSSAGTREAKSISVAVATRREDVKDERPLATQFSPDSGDQEMRNEVSCILPGRLFLTNFRGVENVDELQRLNIKHILCVNEQTNTHPDKFNYFNIDTLEDQEDHDATPYFLQVKKFTDEAIRKGGAVVFHCAAGISRSATMMISYLMASKRLSLYEAFQLTYSRRRVAWPNRSFMRQLIAYERKLQKDGWLAGNKPTITLATWDAWTSGEDSMSNAKLVQQQSVKDMERQSSLKGKDSVQFKKYLERMGKGKHPAAPKR